MTESVVFGTLEDVALRRVWAHEAQGFTPWLADNLDRIASAIGVSLELESKEVRNGPFAADILARNSNDGSLVLIENQLERGDHKHLGQILTYLTGLRTQTVIWVAENFHAEHLSAINWLNENTVEPFAFFAIKLRVVRIGGSPFAPLFEIVARPNEWDRRIQEARPDVGPKALVRRRFWTLFVERHPDCAAEISRGGGASRWLDVPEVSLVVSRWFSEVTAGVFVRGPVNTPTAQIAARLEPHEEELERRLGTKFGNSTYAFEKWSPFKSEDESTWDQMADWIYNEANSYADALRDILGEQV